MFRIVERIYKRFFALDQYEYIEFSVRVVLDTTVKLQTPEAEKNLLMLTQKQFFPAVSFPKDFRLGPQHAVNRTSPA